MEDDFEDEYYSTTDLIADFADAVSEKLYRKKLIFGDSWKCNDWENQCREDLIKHIEKGDPIDVAAYCAFMWYHGWSTKGNKEK